MGVFTATTPETKFHFISLAMKSNVNFHGEKKFYLGYHVKESYYIKENY